MRIAEKYAEQILRSKRDRNLKAEHHGVLVKSWSIGCTYASALEDTLYGELIIQTPFVDISAKELALWIKETFPGIAKYLKQDVPYHISFSGIYINVIYIGPDKRSRKSGLIDIHLRLSKGSYLNNMSVSSIQKFLDSSCNEGDF